MDIDIYTEMINRNIENHINDYYDKDKSFGSCVKYAVKNGKRFRSMITLDIINTLQKNRVKEKKDIISNALTDCSIAIEYAHNASLIMDDLPCMDNATMRRNDLSFHIKYNEPISMLACTGLIFMSTHILSKSIKKLCEQKYFDDYESHKIGFFLLSEFGEWMGINGLSKGQLYDLSLINPDINERLQSDYSNISIEEIFDKKTGSLFEFSFIIGWIIGKGSFDKVEEIKNLSYQFGRLYQILDDFDDYEEDILKQNKTFNYIVREGYDHSVKKVYDLINTIRQSLKINNINSSFFENLLSKFESSFESSKSKIKLL
jgi:geranylgeranyl diphosphate synthase type II